MAGEADNSFGVFTEDLNFERFCDKEGENPEHISQCAESVSAILETRDEVKSFVDSEQTPLELPALVHYLEVSHKFETNVKRKNLLAQQLEDQKIQREAQVEALKEILAEIFAWRRPSNFIDSPTFFGKGNNLKHRPPKGVPVPDWAEQHLPKFQSGIFNDVAFWTAVCMAARRFDTFTNLFVNLEHGPMGLYVFQFFRVDPENPDNRKWETVLIDDLIPCNAECKPVLTTSVDPDETWTLLLQKAYCKFLGSYSLVHNGDTTDHILALTGGESNLMGWDVESVSIKSTCTVWWMLQKCLMFGLPQAAVFLDREYTQMEAGEDIVRMPHFGDYLDGVRIEEKIHYDWNDTSTIILDTYTITSPGPLDGTKLVKVRNAFGNLEWNGDWSNTSPIWTKELESTLQYKRTEDNCTAWMKLDDFVRQYNTLLIVTLIDNAPPVYFDNLYPQAKDNGSICLNAHQYYIKVDTPIKQSESESEPVLCTVNLHLSQPREDYTSTLPRDIHLDMYSMESKTVVQCIDIADHHGNVSKALPEGALELNDMPSQNAFDINKSVRVPPGHYIVIVRQHYYKDTLTYCLAMSADEPEDVCKASMEFVGTSANPQTDKAHLKRIKKLLDNANARAIKSDNK